MVSFIDIIRKLLPGDYSTSVGTPDSRERFKEFVKEVKERVRELRDKEDWEVEDIVVESVEWATKNICKPLKDNEVASVDYYEFVGLYQCSHPSIGQFYLLVHESEDAIGGAGYFGFLLTRNKSEAEELYKSIIEEMYGGEEAKL